MIARVICCIATPDGNRLIHCRLPEAAGVTDCTVGSPRPYRPDTEIGVRREDDRWVLAEPAET